MGESGETTEAPMQEHLWVERGIYGGRPFPVAECSRCGKRIRRRRKDGRGIYPGERARMINVEPLPKGPCEPGNRIVNGVLSLAGIAVMVAVVVLSFLVSAWFWIGFVALGVVVVIVRESRVP